MNALSPNMASLEALQAQVSAQDEISRLLREQLHDVRINRDAWRTQAEAVQHILTDGRPRHREWTSTIGKVNAFCQRCLLLILLTTVLLVPSNLISVGQENIEGTLRCLFPAFDKMTLPAREAGVVSPTYTSEDRDYLIRTIVFEASGESKEGQAAVAHVILTRKRSGVWGDTVKDVVTHAWQFESWMTKRAEMESLDTEDHRYRSAAQIVD